MYTVDRSFPGACALVTGAISASALPDFHLAFGEWLFDRVESDHPELAWHCLVSLRSFPGDARAWRRDDVDHAALNATLFASLDEFLETWDATST